MTTPTTPTGGEPTAEPEMCLVTLEKKMGEALVEAYLAAPTLATRVAELEGMLAEAREALEKIAKESVFSEQRFAEDTDTDYFLRWIGKLKRRAAQALAQLDKEAGGK